MAKKKRKKAKPKIELTPEEKAVPVQEAKPVISETPVIGGEQATAPPGPEPIRPPTMSRSIDEIPTTPTPEEIGPATEPKPVELSSPVICAGCKATVDSSTVRACINPECPRNLVFCPFCAKADTCHKCGKALGK